MVTPLLPRACLVVSDSLRPFSVLWGSSVHGIFQARILKQVAVPPPGFLPDPRIEPRSLESPALAGGFFTTVPWLAYRK